MRTPPILRLSVLVLLALLSACTTSPSPERFEFTRICMGVATRIVTYAPDRESATAAAADAFHAINLLDASFSDYRPDSELMQLCQRAGQPASPPVPVSADLLNILLASRRISDCTDGAFDITVGPCVKLWRQARHARALPEPGALSQARTLIDWRAVRIDAGDATVRFARPGIQLDFGGIAKGYAAQRGRDVLAERGLRSSLVALAGDIAVGSPPPGEAGWRIAIVGEQGTPTGSQPVVLADTCISTSGDTAQFIEIDGRRYSHIIDPRTGLGTPGGISATVIHPDGATADALPTALCILGPDRAESILAAFPAAAAIIEWRDADTIRRAEFGPLPPRQP